MNRRERLLATLNGKPVDRPPVNFYEIGGFKVDPNDPSPYNIYNDDSWKPLLELCEEETDITRMISPIANHLQPDIVEQYRKVEVYENDNGSVFTKTSIKIGDKELTSLTRRDPDINTVWTLEHLLKSPEDAKAFLQLPDEYFQYEINTGKIIEEERILDEKGIVMIEIADPICAVAGLFSMEDFVVLGLTEQELIIEMLEKVSKGIYDVVDRTSKALPGRLWRICGAEYATEPYLPPNLFKEYVVKYTKPIVDMINAEDGYSRIHCHGKISKVLPYFIEMGATAIDPIEPPPQGDVNLGDVRREYGKYLVLFGNIEVSDIENLSPSDFEQVVAKSLVEGTCGEGKGFVLMPSAAPYGRKITDDVLRNYETMVRLTKSFQT